MFSQYNRVYSQPFHSTRVFFSYAIFWSKNPRKLHFFKISQFFGYCQYPNDNLMFTERVKVLNSLYNHIKSFLKCCCTFGDNWLFCFKKWSNFWEDREKRRVLNSPPPHICLWKWSLISRCSFLRACLNALCTIFSEAICWRDIGKILPKISTWILTV